MADLVEKVEKEIEESGERLKLPNMNEFSPGTLEVNSIKQVLMVLRAHQADKDSAISALINAFPKLAVTSQEKQRRVRANNVLIGMSQCGLLEVADRKITSSFTPLAFALLSSDSESEASDSFTRHLLKNCHGLELLDVVTMIRTRGDIVQMDTIRAELRSRGFTITENEANSSKIRLWMEASGVVNSHWEIDNPCLQKVVGATNETLSRWVALTKPQRLFAGAIRKISVDDVREWIPVRQIKNICETEAGRQVFPEGHLRQAIIEPLKDAGWLEAEGTGPGRGGDSGRVRATSQLANLRVDLPLDSVDGIPVDLRDKLAIPREEILADLGSADTYKKGVALELLALRLCRDIGLFPVGFRERSNKTQGAEVDLVANGVHLHYSRWLVQCKNTERVEMKDLAKEIGMAVLLKAHVIVLVTTGKFRRTVIEAANGLAATSGLQAILIDGALLDRYRIGGGNAVIEWLHKCAYQVLALKRGQLHEVED